MAKTEHYFTQFETEKFYHIYNRTVDKSKLFVNDGNYVFFLKKLDEYISKVAEVYAYCLLGNHFHLLVKILPEEQILKNTNSANSSNNSENSKFIHQLVSHQLQKFFQSYALAYNKQQNRVGTLFQKPFKRALIDDDSYFTNLVLYIHGNPTKHGLIKNFKEYKWSSYQRILLDRPSKLKKEEVLDWFGGKEKYIDFHTIDDINLPNSWSLED